MSKNLTTINNINSRAIQPAGCLEDGCVTTRVPANITVYGGGHSRGFGYDRPDRTPERIAKAQAFHAAVMERRKDKSRCPRCGRERGKEYRNCDRCREKIRMAKLRAKGIAVVKGGEYSNADLAAMVIQMRREMDKMHLRFKLWQKAVEYRKTLKYRTNRLRRKYFKPVDKAVADDYLRSTKTTHTP